LLIYTLEGNPINYYATEAGVTQERPTHQGERGLFEEARQPMLWGDQADQELTSYFQRLVALRLAYPALRKGKRKVLHLDVETGAYVYERQLGKGCFLVAFNLEANPQVIKLNHPGFLGAKDLLNNQKVETNGNILGIHLAPLSGAIIGMEKDDE
jgi:glycosidase